MEPGWIISLGAAALLVRVGMALFHTGLSRSKNAASTMLRSVCDIAVAMLAFWAIGAAILLRPGGAIFGLDPRMLFGWTSFGVTGFFYLIFTLAASGIVTGALAERSKIAAQWPVTILLTGVIVPTAGYWAWHGWLKKIGFVDVAGASIIHVSGAMCAAVGAALVSARGGKYNVDRSANMIPGHDLTVAASGMLVMFVGWLPYVLGASIVHGNFQTALAAPSFLVAPATNVVLAAAAGALASLLYARFRFGRLDALLMYSGLLGGLVAISAGASVVNSASAVVIGAVAGILVPVATLVLDRNFRIDDPGGGIAIHGMGGLWGTIAAALFVPVSIGERLKLVGVQAIGVACISVLAIALSLILFLVLRATIGLRSSESEEYDGLDLAEHDTNAYPDFQQTMIKSYHLRQA